MTEQMPVLTYTPQLCKIEFRDVNQWRRVGEVYQSANVRLTARYNNTDGTSPGSYRCRLRYKDEVYEWIDGIIEVKCPETKVTWKNDNTVICNNSWQVSYGTGARAGNQAITYEVQFITGMRQRTIDGKVYDAYKGIDGKTELQTSDGASEVVVWKKSDWPRPGGCADGEFRAWLDIYYGTWDLWKYNKKLNSWSKIYPLPKYL